MKFLVLSLCFAFAGTAVAFSFVSSGQSRGGNFNVELPATTGKYSVGRASFYWVDASRDEPLTKNPNDRRELMVTLWYPAEAASGSPAPYIDNLDKFARVIDPALIKIARSVRSYARAEAKLSSAESRYPVLIFSPGNNSNVATYAALIEELTSHGYVVLGIDHPYESVAVLYPDGRIARFNGEDNRPKQSTPNLPEVFARFYRERVDWRAGDASFALTQLEKLNARNPATQFSNRLDLSRVGGVGHSIGGVAAAQMCQTDRRFNACLNLDGKAASRSLYPNAEGKGPDQPFMSIEKPLPDPTEKQLADWKTTRDQVEQHRKELREGDAELLSTVRAGSYRVLLRGFQHQSFSDQLLILSSGDSNTKAGYQREMTIIREYTLAFFDQTLKSKDSSLLKASPTDYPEVTVERFTPSRP